MSRSYKRSPIVTDGSPHTTKESKKFANKRVRNTDFEDLPTKGKSYKKYYETYDIHDYKERQTKEEAIKDWESKKKQKEQGINNYKWGIRIDFEETKEEIIKRWEKWFRRK